MILIVATADRQGKRARRQRKPGLLLGLTVGLLCGIGHALAEESTLRFDQVFAERGEPSALHFRASFFSKGARHQLEVWREGESRLKRLTDEAVEMHVVRHGPGPEFDMTVLDLDRKIETRIGRTNLYRIGNFTDWFDLAHGLRHPKGAYELALSVAPIGAPKPVGACDWYDLKQSGHINHICWSRRYKIPLLMQAEGGQLLWQVIDVAATPLPRNIFDVHDDGFVRNDADQDIERD